VNRSRQFARIIEFGVLASGVPLASFDNYGRRTSRQRGQAHDPAAK
jgi:hypothetical protein